MRIGADLDDFITDLLDDFIEFYNNNAGLSLTKKNVTSWNVFPREVHEKFKQTGGYTRLNIKPGALDMLRWLNEQGDVFIVTYRDKIYSQQTHEWMEDNLKGNYDEEKVYFSGGPKVNILRELNIDLHIDDSITHTRDAVEKLGIYAILFDNGTPMFNQSEYHPRLFKARDYDEVKRHVLQISSARG